MFDNVVTPNVEARVPVREDKLPLVSSIVPVFNGAVDTCPELVNDESTIPVKLDPEPLASNKVPVLEGQVIICPELVTV